MKFTLALALAVTAASAAYVPEPEPTKSPVPESSYAEDPVPESTYPEDPVPETTYPEDPEYTTEIVTQYTTFCPEPTTVTDGDNVITVTEPTMITITHCPGGCTIEKPCSTSTSVHCEGGCDEPTHPGKPSHGPPQPTNPAEPTYPEHPPSNGTVPKPPPTEDETPVTAGAAKLAGAGFAAFVGLVAFL